MTTQTVEKFVQSKRERERDALLAACKLAWLASQGGQVDDAQLMAAAEKAGWTAHRLQAVLEGYGRAKKALDAFNQYEACLVKNPPDKIRQEIEEHEKAIREHRGAIEQLRLRLSENDVACNRATSLQYKAKEQWPRDVFRAAEERLGLLADRIRSKATADAHQQLLREAQSLLARLRSLQDKLFQNRTWPDVEIREIWEAIDRLADKARQEFGDLLGEMYR